MADFSDLLGMTIGHAQDTEALTGCTAILFDPPVAAGIDVRGSAAGTRATEQLRKFHVVDRIHGICLAGGSSFGLTATGGVLRYLEEEERGFPVGPAVVPIVPSAIIFDLAIGRGDVRPDEDMGYAAAAAACSGPPREGSVGAGIGATIGKLMGMESATKGGFGASCVDGPDGLVVAALVVVNPFGDVLDPERGHIIAGARCGPRSVDMIGTEKLLRHGRPGQMMFGLENTTLAVAVSNAKLEREALIQVAGVMHDGLARVISPVHTIFDGDTCFAAATGQVGADLNAVGLLSKHAVTLAVRSAVAHATGMGGVPSAGELGLLDPE